jgi:Na+/melibiose symporter-like transporter
VLDLTGALRTRVDAALQSALWGAIAAAAAGAAALFLLIALFLALAERYDALTACLVMGAVFVAGAVVAALGCALVARRPRTARRPIDARTLLATGSAEAADAVRDAGTALSESLKQAVRRRPLTALGVMLCAGFVFGVTRR